jgi:hypothetical protein
MGSSEFYFNIESYSSCKGTLVFSGEYPQLENTYNFILDTNFKSSREFSLAVYNLSLLNASDPVIYFQSSCLNGQPTYSSASSILYNNYNQQIINDWDMFIHSNSKNLSNATDPLSGIHKFSNINYSSLLFYANNYNNSVILVLGQFVTYFAIALAVLRMGLRSIYSYKEEKASIINDRMIHNFWKNALSSSKESKEKKSVEKDKSTFLEKFESFLVSSHLKIVSLIIIIIMTLYVYTYLVIMLLYETEKQIYSESGSFSAVQIVFNIYKKSSFSIIILVLKYLCFNHFFINIVPIIKKRTSVIDYWCFIMGWLALNVISTAVCGHYYLSEMGLYQLILKYSRIYLSAFASQTINFTSYSITDEFFKTLYTGSGKVLNKISYLYAMSSMMFTFRTSVEILFLIVYLIVVIMKVLVNPSSFLLTLLINKKKKKIINKRFYKRSASSSTTVENENTNGERSHSLTSASYPPSRKSWKNEQKHADMNMQVNESVFVLNPKATFLSLAVIGLAIGQLIGGIYSIKTKKNSFILLVTTPLLYLVNIVAFNMYAEYMELLRGLNEVSQMKEDFYNKQRSKKRKSKRDSHADSNDDQKSDIFLQELVPQTDLSDTGMNSKMIDDLDTWGVDERGSNEDNLKTYYYHLNEH